MTRDKFWKSLSGEWNLNIAHKNVLNPLEALTDLFVLCLHSALVMSISRKILTL